MKSARIFDLEIAAGTRKELVRRVLSIFECGGAVATVNAVMLERARKSASFHRTLADMALRVPDGVGVARAMHGFGAASEALPGVELGLMLPRLRPNLRIALYGSAPSVAQRAGRELQKGAPESKIVLVRDGYLHTPFEIARELAPLRPDLVYVCLGSPKQEEVSLMLSRLLGRAVVIGLGGSFDIWSGDKRRAPSKMRALGLEWLWRMIREPRRFFQFPTLVSFKMHIFAEQICAKFTKSGGGSAQAKK